MSDNKRQGVSEEVTVAGYDVFDKVKELVQAGNVRRLILRRPNGKVLVDVPLTAGVGVAGVLTILAPMLTALAAMAALVTHFRVEIEREPGRPNKPSIYDHDPGGDT